MVLNGSNVLSRRCRLHAATWLDERFVAYCRGSERLGGKGSEFITDLVVTQEDKTTLLTFETMADRKGRSTTIAQRWKARRSVRIAQVKRVTELMCRRQCTADECWRNSLVALHQQYLCRGFDAPLTNDVWHIHCVHKITDRNESDGKHATESHV